MNKRIKKKREAAISTPKRVTYNRAKTLIKWANDKAKRKATYDYPLEFIRTEVSRYYISTRKMLHRYRPSMSTIDIFPGINMELRKHFRGWVSLNTPEIIYHKPYCRYAIITDVEGADYFYSEAFIIIDTFKKIMYHVDVGTAANAVAVRTLLPYIDFRPKAPTKESSLHPCVLYCEELNDIKIDTTSYDLMTDSLYEIGMRLWDKGIRFSALKLLKQQYFDAYNRD